MMLTTQIRIQTFPKSIPKTMPEARKIEALLTRFDAVLLFPPFMSLLPSSIRLCFSASSRTRRP